MNWVSREKWGIPLIFELSHEGRTYKVEHAGYAGGGWLSFDWDNCLLPGHEYSLYLAQRKIETLIEERA